MNGNDERRMHGSFEGWGRRVPAAAGVLMGLGLLLGGASEAQATETPVWPVGKCVDGKLVAGEGFHVLQGYNVDNDFVGRCASVADGGLGLACKHGGIDINEEGDTTNLTVGEPVLAMANGEVLEIIDWGAEGVGVIVEHVDGTMAHYVHLSSSYVQRGEQVRQGQPLGAIMDYPYGGNGNDHLHLELRSASLTVKTCTNAGEQANCDMESDFHWECKGNGYALDKVGSTTVDANAYGFIDPSGALRDGALPDASDLWTPPGDDPLVDLRFLPGESGSVRNYGAGGGAASGSVTIEKPYDDLPDDFCDQAGRGSVSYQGTADTSFASGVILDMDLHLDQITTEDYVDVVRGGDDEHTTWRLAVRVNPQSKRRELALQVTLAKQAEGSGAEGEAPVYLGAEIVGELPEPQCRAAAAEASCSSGLASTPSTCTVPADCDPNSVELHCFSDLGYRQWHHVAATYDSSAGSFQLVLDDDVIASGFTDGELQPPTGTFTIYVGEGGVAAMDDVRVWDLSNLGGEKSDDLDTFGDAPRGGVDNGCQCQAEPGSTGAGGSLLLLLGLWGLRRRRSA